MAAFDPSSKPAISSKTMTRNIIDLPDEILLQIFESLP